MFGGLALRVSGELERLSDGSGWRGYLYPFISPAPAGSRLAADARPDPTGDSDIPERGVLVTPWRPPLHMSGCTVTSHLHPTGANRIAARGSRPARPRPVTRTYQVCCLRPVVPFVTRRRAAGSGRPPCHGTSLTRRPGVDCQVCCLRVRPVFTSVTRRAAGSGRPLCLSVSRHEVSDVLPPSVIVVQWFYSDIRADGGLKRHTSITMEFADSDIRAEQPLRRVQPVIPSVSHRAAGRGRATHKCCDCWCLASGLPPPCLPSGPAGPGVDVTQTRIRTSRTDGH